MFPLTAIRICAAATTVVSWYEMLVGVNIPGRPG